MIQRCLLIGFLLVFASILTSNVSSSSTSSTFSTSSPSHRSPFAPSERTRVSGFGAQHAKRSIFSQAPSKKDARLYVYKHDNVLWLQDMDNDQRLCISVNNHGDWVVEEEEKTTSTRINSKPPSLDDDRWIPVEGIYGFYKIASGILLVLIAQTEPVYQAPSFGKLKDWWNIHKVKHLEVIHLSNTHLKLTPNHVKEEVRQLRLFRKALKQHEFYCCNSTLVQDMTKPIQTSFRSYNNSKSSSQQAISWWSTNPDPRFFWNQLAVNPILCRTKENPCAQVLLKHTIPLTSAFVGVQSNITCSSDTSDDKIINYTQLLISRRSRFRAGTRFTRRGADATGAVANYVETEQVTLLSNTDSKKKKKQPTLDRVASHVQIRGSIPIRWSSPADVKTYAPKVRIGTDPLAQARALRWHLLEQQSYYTGDNKEDMVFVNLVDQKSDQGRLGKAFDEVLKAVVEVHNNATNTKVRVKHVWYDFHAQVKNGKWDRLSILLKDLQPFLVKHGYFSATSDANTSKNYKIDSKQKSVVRTNCMDCLDRTNVVQSILGRLVLFQQMDGLGNKEAKKKFRKAKQLFLPWEQAESCHRSLWADNADEISRLYAGTPALKRDFTRTGKRTKMGALDDGMNSLQRYYLNNFLDADRQEGMDLMVGHSKFSNVGGSSPPSAIAANNGEEDAEEFGAYAARRAFLGNIFGKKPIEEVETLGDDEKDALDLRWVPGDLQEHLRSQADDAQAAPSSSTSTTKPRFGFSSSKALKAMDQRSISDLPWWSFSLPTWSSSSSSSTSTSSTTNTDSDTNEIMLVDALDPHQRHPTLTRGQVLGVLIFGFKAPRTLATSIVSLLGALYLKDIVQHDIAAAWKVKQKIEHGVKEELEEEEDKEEDSDEE
jgi:hypothetical protein